MAIKCAIFDMDGLISDTEELHFLSYKKALSESEITLSLSDYIDHWVNRGEGIVEYLKIRNDSVPAELVKSKKTKYFVESVKKNNIDLFCGVKEILSELNRKQFLVGLASSASLVEIYAVLGKTGLRECFKHVVGKEDVKKTKPSPELFLELAKRFGCKPSECVVFEDAEKGIKAAKDAGMVCIAVPNKHTAGRIYSNADQILDSLEKVNVDHFNIDG